MTSDARKQAWAAEHRLMDYECCETFAWWRFESRHHIVWLHLHATHAFCVSNRSTVGDKGRRPALHGIVRPLLELIPPDQYARAVAMQLTRNYAPRRSS